MVTPGSKPVSRPWLVHPVLFAVVPVLVLYAANLGDLQLSELWLPAGLALAGGLLVWWACTLAARHRARGAVLASLFWAWFFAYGPWQRWLEPDRDFGLYLGLTLYWVILLLAILWLVTTKYDFTHVSGALNLVAVGLLVLQLVLIIPTEVRRFLHRPRPHRVAARVPARADLPHIYLIVLDGYARSDVLADIYHYDNRPFLDFLRRRGFQVASASRANYCQTLLSLSSCLNLDYLDDVVKRTGADSNDRQPIGQLIDDNRTRTLLRAAGYEFAAFPTGYVGTEMPEAAGRHAPRRLGELTEFETVLLADTALYPFLRRHLYSYMDSDHVRAAIMLRTLDQLAPLARSPHPTFVFAHIVNPHPPFIFRRDGAVIPVLRHTGLADGSDFTGTRKEYIAAYREQVEFISRRMQAVVDDILARADRPTAIVLMSDHGPGAYLDWWHLENTDLRERFSTLVALRLPQQRPAKLDDHITTVNVMRFLLSQCLGADLPPLPSRAYFSDCKRPYRFTEVTDGTGGFRRFTAPAPGGRPR